MQRVLEHQPPRLEVIDEPAVPAEGRLPSWGAVAAATAVPVVALATAEIAAPEGDDLAEDGDILAMPPPAMSAEPISSVEFGDDADVITFDDSLLLDEPTETLPRVQVDGAEPAADEAHRDDRRRFIRFYGRRAAGRQ